MNVCPSILANPQTMAGSSRPARSPCNSTNLSEMFRAMSRKVGLLGCRATCNRWTGVSREYVSFRSCQVHKALRRQLEEDTCEDGAVKSAQMFFAAGKTAGHLLSSFLQLSYRLRDVDTVLLGNLANLHIGVSDVHHSNRIAKRAVRWALPPLYGYLAQPKVSQSPKQLCFRLFG